MTDNTPARREDNLPTRRNSRTTPNTYSFGNDNFYYREDENEAPVVLERRVRLDGRCKMCTLVPTLIENGYSFEEATDVERDFYQKVYTFWPATDIARWLKHSHDLKIAHDSVSNHITKHITDPQAAMADRIKQYKPDYMNKQFFGQLADTMKLTVLKFQQRVALGEIEIGVADFINVSKMLREWQDFLGALNEDKTDLILQAVGETLEEVLGPHPDIHEQFTTRFSDRLEELENGEA